MNFHPIEIVLELLAELRNVGFDWIADEVEETIRNGKTAVTAGRQANIPFTPYEQEAILLGTLREYFVGTDAIQGQIGKDLQQNLGNADLESVVLNEDGQEIITLSGKQRDGGESIVHNRSTQEIEKLNELLQSAWPSEVGDFPRRVRAATQVEE